MLAQSRSTFIITFCITAAMRSLRPSDRGVNGLASNCGAGPCRAHVASHGWAGSDASVCDPCTSYESREHSWIRCAPGPRIVSLRQFRLGRSVHSGGKRVEVTENPGRERILERIQTALRAPAKPPAASTASTLFAPVPNPLERFQQECVANNTECVLADNSAASAAAVSSLVTSFPPGEIFVQDEPSLRRMESIWNSHAVRWSSQGAPQESSQATITLAEWLVAETGSVFVSSSCGGRAATVAAPVHIVVASVAQLVPDLTTLFLKVREKGTAERNSMLCLITGSSRTADIEKTLVMGAHGPRRLIVVLDLERKQNGEPK